MVGTFHLIKYDENGVMGKKSNMRLVCVTDLGEKVAIWGKEGSTRNIDTILSKGLPCTIECKYRVPSKIYAERYGHTYWVRENFELKVLD